MKSFFTIVLICSCFVLQAQIIQKESLTFEAYMDYVKAHHPLVKQADLVRNTGAAELQKARGGFDPKIEVDWNNKEFKGTNYYNTLNSTFKIPTWYGIELKANFEQNTGDYLNRSLTVPEDGLYSAGISFSLGQGFLINERMASLKKARFFREQSKADRELLVNQVIFEASIAYLDWLEASNEEQIVAHGLKNASQRFSTVKRSIEAGDKAAIDSVEAKIALQNRQLSLEAARLKRIKAALKASNHLWIEKIPLEIKDHVFPVNPKVDGLSNMLLTTRITDSLTVAAHPKIQSLNNKYNALRIDRKLKQNKLLPKLDVQYNVLSQTYNEPQLFSTANYKAFASFSIPLFLRKERSDLKLAKLKLQHLDFERVSQALTIQNKIKAINNEITSLEQQKKIVSEIVMNYETLLKGEERKFFMGESSLFVINYRESSLISAQLKENKISIKRLAAKVKLFNALGRTPHMDLN